MRCVWVVGVALFAAAPAFAADAPKTIAGVAGDINGDGVADRAVLIDNDGDVDLAVYLSSGGKLPAEPTLYKKAFGWTGAMAGTEPEIKINPRGSLIVVFRNDAIGRDRWRMQFTVAWRDNALVVAGYAYEFHDTLDLKHRGACDLNLLTGQGTRDGKTVKVAAGSMPLAGWTDDSAPAPCKFEQ